MVRKRFSDSSLRMATIQAQDLPPANSSAKRGENSSNSIPRLNQGKYPSSAITPDTRGARVPTGAGRQDPSTSQWGCSCETELRNLNGRTYPMRSDIRSGHNSRDKCGRMSIPRFKVDMQHIQRETPLFPGDFQSQLNRHTRNPYRRKRIHTPVRMSQKPPPVANVRPV